MAMDFKYDKIEDVDESCIVGYKGIYNKYVKRIIDLILSVLLFVILSPVFVIISVAIIIDSGFPVFYRAERGGYKNKTFKIFKFRIMVKNADKIDLLLLGPHFSQEVPKYCEMLKDYCVKVTSIDPDNYACLDGESILEDAMEFYEGVYWEGERCQVRKSKRTA